MAAAQRDFIGVNHEHVNGVNGSQFSPSEKDFNNHLSPEATSQDALKRLRTAGSISMSPEMFEKIYLSPQNKVRGELRGTFANPTPLAIIGFLLALSPLSCELMGWRGSGGGGAATIGSYYFFGGLLMILGGLGEWIIGNTFPFVVFSSFGAFWLQLAATLQPFFNAYTAYSPTGDAAEGVASVGFNSGYGFLLLAMALMCFIYLICSLRTNVVFFLIFFSLVLLFTTLTGAYFHTANGNLKLAKTLTTTAGAFGLVTCACGWWIFLSIMLASLDFPFQIPVGDLSQVIKGASSNKSVENDKDV